MCNHERQQAIVAGRIAREAIMGEPFYVVGFAKPRRGWPNAWPVSLVCLTGLGAATAVLAIAGFIWFALGAIVLGSP
jgi:hypothetical protein